MNTINFQPQGIYQQFASNKQALYKAQENIGAKDEMRQNKAKTRNIDYKKYAKYTAAAAIIAGALFLHKQYKKGLDAINLKDKILSNVKDQADFDDFIKSKPFSTLEIQEFKKVWSDYNRYKTNAVGMIHSFFNSVSDFFKNNFYNY